METVFTIHISNGCKHMDSNNVRLFKFKNRRIQFRKYMD